MTVQDFFQENTEVAVALSGGVDSAYLLYEARKNAKRVCAYFVKSAFQPAFELEDAKRLARETGAELRLLPLNVLEDAQVAKNPKNRCYYCKKHIFETIREAAEQDGFSLLLDGTNASDEVADRPGMRAIEELLVRSPLRECGLTKDEIRKRAKEAGLFVWDKPAYACLATRIATGEEITEGKLRAAECAENFLFSLGFTDFRVRSEKNTAKLQIREAEAEKLIGLRKEIVQELRKYYDAVVLDLEVMR